ncbi:MAG: DUF4097 family beta strand repeat-containing protein [Clostridia bacterium]|nr:DUF4097 family beta strand repeat-containing protein [Clostridia bacterium]
MNMKRIILLALCLVWGGWILAGCSGGEPFAQKDYTADGERIAEIRIDVRDRRIEVARASDNQIHIAYYESGKEYYDISISDGNVLTMSAAVNKDWTDYIGAKPAAGCRKISLQVPDGLLTALRLSTTNEDISLPTLTVLEDIELSSTGGNILFDQLGAGNTIALRAKNGNISGAILGSCDEYAVSCKVKKGESNLPSEKAGGEKTLAITNNNGDVDITFAGE